MNWKPVMAVCVSFLVVFTSIDAHENENRRQFSGPHADETPATERSQTRNINSTGVSKQEDDGANGEAESVKPGINRNYLNPDLDIDSFVRIFEIESREVFAARLEILKEVGLRPGTIVADIGAGTGMYTRMFARTVGPRGWVYAVDISPKFIEHIRSETTKLGLPNVTPVLCAENSVSLPRDSIQAAFICDTYHHFEYPRATMRSIYDAMQSDGRLFVVDFERIPDKTREWLLRHVRADKATFRSEIESVGFEFVREADVSGLEENYFLEFRKPANPPDN